MSNTFDDIKNLPDVSFIDNLTLENIQASLITNYETKYTELTGKVVSLAEADPYRIILLANSQLLYQLALNIDKAGKQNLLKYSYGGYLDNLAAFKNTTRNAAQYASTNVKFSLSQIREVATPVPKGTRITGDNEIFFETTEYKEIPVGEIETTVLCQCQTAGTIGNNFAIGELSTLVDPIAFIISVTNIDISAGGTEVENDESLAEKTYLAPSSYSTAGAEDAYEYWVRQSNPDIGDIKIITESDATVKIVFVLKDGAVPEGQVINATKEYVSSKTKRPLTDKVEVVAPELIDYTINLKYFINKSDENNALNIQQKVTAAIAEYKLWQGQKIGRDINPDELITKIRNAGAKRVEIIQPIFTKVDDIKKANCTSELVSYGGLEDD